MKKVPVRFFRQSAALPYRRQGDRIQVLLVTSIKRGRWIRPKGGIEAKLSAYDSAAKEAYEEAGIQGHIGKNPIGVISRKKWGGICTITIFLMEVTHEFDEWPEAGKRRRRSVSTRAAK